LTMISATLTTGNRRAGMPSEYGIMQVSFRSHCRSSQAHD
jgi:hypothetical protein